MGSNSWSYCIGHHPLETCWYCLQQDETQVTATNALQTELEHG
jgi:hypothetical protein